MVSATAPIISMFMRAQTPPHMRKQSVNKTLYDYVRAIGQSNTGPEIY